MKKTNKQYISVYDYKAMMALKAKLLVNNKEGKDGHKEESSDREPRAESVGGLVGSTSDIK